MIDLTVIKSLDITDNHAEFFLLFLANKIFIFSPIHILYHIRVMLFLFFVPSALSQTKAFVLSGLWSRLVFSVIEMAVYRLFFLQTLIMRGMRIVVI